MDGHLLSWTLLLVIGLSGACASESQRRLAEAREQEFTDLCAQYPTEPLALGRKLFERQCISCHQADGLGTRNAIPPLAGHVPTLLLAPGGRAYIANVVVHGLAGSVDVLGVTYKNRMPAHGPLLRDTDIEAVLAYVSMMWGNDALRAQAPLVRATDAQAARMTAKRDDAVMALRPVLLPR